MSHIEPALAVDAAAAGEIDTVWVSGLAVGAAGVVRDAGACAGRASARRFGVVVTMRGDFGGFAAASAGLSTALASGAIKPSDSETTREVGEPGDAAAVGDAGEPSEVPDVLWRTAKYEPPAAAARQPTVSPANASLLNSIAV